jgi:RNA polymerase sigma-70 factor (ECF subfamily)
VAALPEELRLAVVLAEYENRSQAEIAEIMGCTTKAVEMRLYRARHQLRATLASVIGDL